MKLTQSELTEALKAVGLADVHVVADEAESEYDLSSFISKIDDNRGKVLRPLIEEELEPKAWEKATGKYGGLLRNKLAKASGIPVSRLSKLDSDEEAIAAAFTYLTENLQGDAKETKARFDEITRLHNEQIEKLTAEHTNALSAEKNIRIERDALDYISNNILKDIPLPDEADRTILARDYYNSLKNDFNPTYDEVAKSLNLFDKTKPTFPAMKEGTTQPLDMKEHATSFLSVRGLVKKDMREIKPADAMRNQQNLESYKPNAGFNNGVTAPTDLVNNYLESQGVGK